MELRILDRILTKGLQVYIIATIALMPIIDSLPDIVSYTEFTILMTWSLFEYLRLRKLLYDNSFYKYDVIFCLVGLGICWYYNDGQWWFLLLILVASTIARFIEPLKGMLRR